MANEALSGAFQGISSGLSEVTNQRLNAFGLQVREGRNAAFNRRTNILESREERESELHELERPSLEDTFAAKQAEAKAAKVIEESKVNMLSTKDILDAEIGVDAYPPELERAFEEQVIPLIGRRDSEGKVSEFDLNEFKKKTYTTPEGIGSLEVMKKVYSKAIFQDDELIEAMKAEREKLLDKDPFLRSNSEARRLNPKVAELDNNIENLINNSKMFSAQNAGIDQLIKKQKESKRIEEKIKTLNTLRGANILAGQGFKQPVVTPSKLNEQALQQHMLDSGITDRIAGIKSFREATRTIPTRQKPEFQQDLNKMKEHIEEINITGETVIDGVVVTDPQLIIEFMDAKYGDSAQDIRKGLEPEREL